MPPALPAEALERLLAAARAAQPRAHAPYSGFRVGAAVLDEEGRIFAGCNVENAAFPLTSCAEANAIGAMVAAGGRRIAALAVVGEGEALVTPCGGCRQRLRELAPGEASVVVADRERVRARFTLAELLPASFGPENLAPGASR